MKTKDLMAMSAAQLVMLAQDNQIRIEELEKKNIRLGCEVASRNKRALDGDKHVAAAINALMRIEELEAKLKIVVEALEESTGWNWLNGDVPHEIEKQIQEALTKIKGDV